MNLLFIQAKPCVPVGNLEEEDVDVAGIYSVEVPVDVAPGISAGIALDAFHSKIAVGNLEDFDFTVTDKDGNVVVEAEEYESYSGTAQAGAVSFVASIDDAEGQSIAPAP